MFNNLGIFSNNLIQGLRPGINLRKPAIRTVQIAYGSNNGLGGGSVISGGGGTGTIVLSTTTSIPQVIAATTTTATVSITSMTLTAPTTSTYLATFHSVYDLVSTGTVSATFGIYDNGILLPGSSKTVSSPSSIFSGTVALSTTTSLVIGDVITAGVTNVVGTLTVYTSTLKLIQV